MQEIGLIGLGRMGANMARRLARAGFKLAVCNRTAEVAHKLAEEERNLRAVDSYAALVASLPAPRIVWLMLPAGEATATALHQLAGLLSAGDLLVDGANAYYQDSMRHARELADQGIEFVDAGVSGGVWGLDNGYALMLGGAPGSVARLKPLIEALAPGAERGWVHCGPAGAGHFAKMVHNGIEYGLMAAYAEGYELLTAKDIVKDVQGCFQAAHGIQVLRVVRGRKFNDFGTLGSKQCHQIHFQLRLQQVLARLAWEHHHQA